LLKITLESSENISSNSSRIYSSHLLQIFSGSVKILLFLVVFDILALLKMSIVFLIASYGRYCALHAALRLLYIALPAIYFAILSDICFGVYDYISVHFLSRAFFLPSCQEFSMSSIIFYELSFYILVPFQRHYGYCS